MLSTCLHYA
jgi:hypothetical protein